MAPDPHNRKGVRGFVRERWGAAYNALFGEKRRTSSPADDSFAEKSGPVTTVPRPWRWLRLRATFRELVAACVAAAIGVIGGQIVLPALSPNLERWAFSASTRFSFGEPQFLTIASTEEIEARGTTVPGPGEWELNRIFCGLALFNTKYCLMQPVKVTVGKKLEEWPLNRESGSTVKALLIGDNGKYIAVSWISQQYGTSGWAHLGRRSGNDFVGYGIGCVADSSDAETGNPFPIKVLVGELTSAPVSDLTAFQRMLLDKMAKSTMQVTVRGDGNEGCGKV